MRLKNSKMKIIFLDIDGVLNSMDWCENQKDSGRYTEINPEKVKMLKEIVDRTGAIIVLSSTWRTLSRIPGSRNEHPQYTYLVDSIADYGLKIKSHTPYINNNRPEEIMEWISEYEDKEDIQLVCLDDDFWPEHYEKYGMKDHLVHTCFYEADGGLRKEHVEKAVKILNGGKS